MNLKSEEIHHTSPKKKAKLHIIYRDECSHSLAHFTNSIPPFDHIRSNHRRNTQSSIYC
ncbi:hypothetical protein AKJ16_DCAP20456 [Drosera capensis]